jgi:capsular exopolysaccharide synthesis family protein
MADPTKAHRPLPGLITEADPRAPASEAYRTLRTNIQFASLDQPYRSIVVTSASRGEGKTTTAANFAVVCAQAGSRVCLVDADLRRPMLHRLFGLENGQGLTDAVLEGVPFARVARPTRVPHLSVIPSGALPPNPAELVGSRRMRELLTGAAADFDLVLLDSPPVVPVSDPVALAAQCDGVVLVVRASGIPHEVVRRAAEQIEAVKGRILGVVLNRVNLKRDGYYSDYYRYYRSYYGRPHSQ